MILFHKYKRRNISKVINHANEQKFTILGKTDLLAFNYFICNSLNALLINPEKRFLSYKQAAWTLWFYDWEKILLGCPTAQGLGLIQECISLVKSIKRSKPRPSDPENSQFQYQCGLAGRTALQRPPQLKDRLPARAWHRQRWHSPAACQCQGLRASQDCGKS